MSKRDPFVPDPAMYELAFDQFSRQYQAKKLVEATRTKKRLKILDVGGHKGVTREFFPQDAVTISDLFDVDEPGYVKASALDLPFADGSYDVVMCFDVLEHIPASDRLQFLSEITRVASGYVLVAAPFDTVYVADAERELNDYFKQITGEPHLWLSEHIDNGLPKRQEIEKFFADRRIGYTTYDLNNILLWTTIQNLIFLAHSVKAPERISKLNRYYNEHLPTIGDSTEPSYRRIYFAAKSGKLPERGEIVEPISLEVVRQGINEAAVAMHQMIYGSAPIYSKNEEIRSQAEILAEKDREIARIKNQLDDIVGSRSYRLAQALRKTKNAVLPRRRSS